MTQHQRRSKSISNNAIESRQLPYTAKHDSKELADITFNHSKGFNIQNSVKQVRKYMANDSQPDYLDVKDFIKRNIMGGKDAKAA